MATGTTNAEAGTVQGYRLPGGMPFTLTIAETAEILHCGINSCYEAAGRGDIPTIRIGRRIIVPTLALMRLLDSGESTVDTEGSAA